MPALVPAFAFQSHASSGDACRVRPGVFLYIAVLFATMCLTADFTTVMAQAAPNVPGVDAHTDASTVRSMESLRNEALAYRDRILKGGVKNTVAATSALAESRANAARGKWWVAIRELRRAINLGYRDDSRWMELSRLQNDYSAGSREAILAAYLAGLESGTPAAQAEGFARAAELLMFARKDKDALALYREAVEHKPLPEYERAVNALLGKDLLVRTSRVEPERDLARVCVELTSAVSRDSSFQIADYVEVEPRVETTVGVLGKEVCIDGLPHGRSTTVTFKTGLKADNGTLSSAPLTVSLSVPNRTPRGSFMNDAYILPVKGGQMIALKTINMDSMNLTLSRVNDRSLVALLRDRGLTSSVSEYDVRDIRDNLGEQVWSGTVEINNVTNQEVTTGVKVSEILPKPKPGLYLLTAADKAGKATTVWNQPFQWLLVTDIGLQTVQGPDGLHVFAHALETGEPIKDLSLTLLARNNERIGQASTDKNGHGIFSPGLLSGKRGRLASFVMAYDESGDFAYLDISGPAFDLSDRGVGGRAPPGPIDAFVYTDRGIYRPGETVNLTAVLRDDKSNALGHVPVTIKLFRPDGVQAGAYLIDKSANGMFVTEIPTLRSALTGSWEARAYVDPKAPPVGQVRFLVDDFAPLTMSLALKAESPFLDLASDEPAEVSVQADYLYGAPVAEQAVTPSVTLNIDPKPFAAYPDFSFGLVQESFATKFHELAETKTDADGHAMLDVVLDGDDRPDTSHPLRALVRAEVTDASGQSVARTVILPVRSGRVNLGIRQNKPDQEIELGRPAIFDLLALSPDGQPLAEREVDWTLVEEVPQYVWYRSEGAWNYKRVINDEIRATGNAKTGPDGLVGVSQGVTYGAFRLEITDRAEPLAAASVRFRSGWWVSETTDRDTPDTMKITTQKTAYGPTETVRAHIKAPFAGEATIQIINEDVVAIQSVPLPKDGLDLDLPITDDWGVGAYIVATAYRPANDASGQGPGRAMGVVWVGVDNPDHRLSVNMTSPEIIRPETTLSVPVAVDGANGSPVSLTVAAVDEGILQLTDFDSPNPTDHFLGKRRLAYDFRDAYGRLLRAVDAKPGRLREGGDASDRSMAGLPESSVKTVSLFSGLVNLDKDGRGVVTFDVPDFNGKLRLMAVASSSMGVGQAETSVIVRDPVVALTALPRFLAPNDRAVMAVNLDNQEAPAGPWTVRITGENGVVISPEQANQTVTLAEKGRSVVRVNLTGEQKIGTGVVKMTLSGTGLNGETVNRESTWNLGIRSPAPRMTDVHTLDLTPGKTGTYSADLIEGLDRDTAIVGLDLATVPNMDTLSHVAGLNRYPYECLEQTVSRAYAALYADDLGATGLSTKAGSTPEDVLAWAVNRVVSLQRADGGFALWSSRGSLEPWLSAYALDFLLNAREKDTVAVPDFALTRGLGYLQERVLSNEFETVELPIIAYYHYVLAKAGANDIAQLRYFQDVYGDRLPTLLSRSHTAAALSILGDETRAARAMVPPTRGPSAVSATPGARGNAPTFQEAALTMNMAEDLTWWYYGSRTRDQAATLALGIEARLPGFDALKVADELALAYKQRRSLSTQEMSWMVRGAYALKSYQGKIDVALNGAKIEGDTVMKSVPLTLADLDNGITLKNLGERIVRTALTVDAQTLEPAPGASHGISIKRRYFTLNGDVASLSDVVQNRMYVAVIEGKVTEARTLHPDGTPVLIVDLLPAGMVISNPAFGSGQDTDSFSWLEKMTPTLHTEARDDRFVAGLKLKPDQASFRLAYVVRATTPGDFVLPGVAAEFMDRTFIRGSQGPARLTIIAPN